MLQVMPGVIRCISDFKKPCASKTAGLRVKDTSRSLCCPVLCGHCLPSCQAERQAPGLLVLFQPWVFPILKELQGDVTYVATMKLSSVYVVSVKCVRTETAR